MLLPSKLLHLNHISQQNSYRRERPLVSTGCLKTHSSLYYFLFELILMKTTQLSG